MTNNLPPRPGSPKSPPASGGGLPGVHTGPVFKGQEEAAQFSQRAAGGRSKASPLPLVLSIAGICAGAALIFFRDQSYWVGIAGYLLAGFTVIVMVGWDSLSQRAGMKDPNYETRPGWTRALRILVFVGFIVAAVHLTSVALSLAEMLSELWGLQ